MKLTGFNAILANDLTTDKHYPWRVLATCVLQSSTLTSVMIEEFFSIVHSPEAMLNVDKKTIDHVLRPLGSHQMRYTVLYRMTRDYLEGLPAYKAYGVTDYMRDALQLFAHGAILCVYPSDRGLKEYLYLRRTGLAPVQWDRVSYERWRNSFI